MPREVENGMDVVFRVMGHGTMDGLVLVVRLKPFGFMLLDSSKGLYNAAIHLGPREKRCVVSCWVFVRCLGGWVKLCLVYGWLVRPVGSVCCPYEVSIKML